MGPDRSLVARADRPGRHRGQHQGRADLAESSAASYLLRTTDDGQSFSNALSLGDGGEGWSDLAFVTPAEAVVINGAGQLYMSHDAGAHWSQVTF
jgi:photosystem II stability/assembly factor-like uncharacterized protein